MPCCQAGDFRTSHKVLWEVVMKPLHVIAVLISVLSIESYARSPYESMAGVNLIVRNSMIHVAVITGSEDIDCDKLTHSFIQGVDSYNNVIMSVRCRPAGDYIFIERADGTATILDCEKADQLFADLGINGRCWVPLNDPNPASRY